MPLSSRTAAGLLGGVLATGALAAAPPPVARAAPAAGRPAAAPARIGGANRYATAAAVARAVHPDGVDAVVLTRGDAFPDALTSAPLTRTLSAALLLTRPGELPAATSSALAALHPRRVVLVGGPAAVSPAVEARLRRSYAVQRISGADRYATAAAVAARVEAGPNRTVGGRHAVFVVSGERFADAAVVGAPATHGAPTPVLLTRAGSTPAATASAIRDLHLGTGYLVGGGAAVSPASANGLRRAGLQVQRIGGADRALTAAAVAQAFYELGARTAVLARGDDFPDALVAGPYAGAVGAPVLLTATPSRLGQPTADRLLARSVAVGRTAVVPIGGTTAVSTAVVAAAVRVAGGTALAGDLAARALVRLDARGRAGQLLMPGVSAASGPSDALLRELRADEVGSVMLTGRSSAGVSATRALVDRLRAQTAGSTAGSGLAVATDQEGGLVQVLSGPGFSDIPRATTQGRYAPATLRSRAATWGRQLAAAGVDVDLAPVLDTVPPGLTGSNQPIGRYDREYGTDPAAVTAHGRAFANGLADAGVAATAKHFPGLGRATGNTDTSAGVTDPTGRTDPYLQPYAAAVRQGVPLVMVSTAVYPNIDPGHPGAYSSAVVADLLRAQLGYDGVVVSDSLSATAAQVGPVGRRAVDLVAAGGDLALVSTPTDLPALATGLRVAAAANPVFRTELDGSALRVLRLKAGLGLVAAS